MNMKLTASAFTLATLLGCNSLSVPPNAADDPTPVTAPNPNTPTTPLTPPPSLTPPATPDAFHRVRLHGVITHDDAPVPHHVLVIECETPNKTFGFARTNSTGAYEIHLVGMTPAWPCTTVTRNQHERTIERHEITVDASVPELEWNIRLQ